MTIKRTPPKKKAKELAKYLRAERPDYSYLKSIFRALTARVGDPGSPDACTRCQRFQLKRKFAFFTKLSGIAETSPIWS